MNNVEHIKLKYSEQSASENNAQEQEIEQSEQKSLGANVNWKNCTEKNVLNCEI